MRAGAGSNLAHSIRSELGVYVRLAHVRNQATPLRVHIMDIFRLRPEKQVLRVAAKTVVAVMQNDTSVP